MSELLYRRRLPHWVPHGKVILLGFRLAGSLPRLGPEILAKDASPQPLRGPIWLIDPRVAKVVQDALLYGAVHCEWYQLHAHVIMPNHVHILLDPYAELARITQWLKGRTARVCNQILGRTGAFWQDESYDHWVRSYKEFEDTVRYIESNPVRAGLVEHPDLWKWSSAAGCCAAGQATKNDGPPHGIDGCGNGGGRAG